MNFRITLIANIIKYKYPINTVSNRWHVLFEATLNIPKISLLQTINNSYNYSMLEIQNILTILIFIILYFQLVHAQRTMSIEDVLKIKNEYYVSFYCKNDICVETDFMYDDETVDIPDEHGNITTYIPEKL